MIFNILINMILQEEKQNKIKIQSKLFVKKFNKKLDKISYQYMKIPKEQDNINVNFKEKIIKIIKQLIIYNKQI